MLQEGPGARARLRHGALGRGGSERPRPGWGASRCVQQRFVMRSDSTTGWRAISCSVCVRWGGGGCTRVCFCFPRACTWVVLYFTWVCGMWPLTAVGKGSHLTVGQDAGTCLSTASLIGHCHWRQEHAHCRRCTTGVSFLFLVERCATAAQAQTTTSSAACTSCSASRASHATRKRPSGTPKPLSRLCARRWVGPKRVAPQ